MATSKSLFDSVLRGQKESEENEEKEIEEEESEEEILHLYQDGDIVEEDVSMDSSLIEEDEGEEDGEALLGGDQKEFKQERRGHQEKEKIGKNKRKRGGPDDQGSEKKRFPPAPHPTQLGSSPLPERLIFGFLTNCL